MSARGREWAFRAAALLVALLGFEASLRALDQPRRDSCFAPQESYWLPDDALGFAYRPGAEVASGTINALGLRGPVPAREKPAGTQRVLFVGDSSAYGFRVSDEESFWWLATRALAAARPGTLVEPIVAAAPGYSSHHSRVLLERFLPYQPDPVVFYVGAYNDHRRRRYFPDAEIPARMARRRAAWHDVRTLQSGELVANLVGGWADRAFRDPSETLRVPPDRFAANVRAMLAATRAAGARAVVLVPPFSEKLRRKRPSIPAYEAILRDEAAAAGARVVELGPLFADPAAAFLRDQIHPSPLGHQRIAEAIATVVLAGP